MADDDATEITFSASSCAQLPLKSIQELAVKAGIDSSLGFAMMEAFLPRQISASLPDAGVPLRSGNDRVW